MKDFELLLVYATVWSQGGEGTLGEPEDIRVAKTVWDDKDRLRKGRLQRYPGANITYGAPFPIATWKITQYVQWKSMVYLQFMYLKVNLSRFWCSKFSDNIIEI